MSASLCGRSSTDTTTACPTHSGIKDGIKIFSPQKQKSKSSKGVVWYSSFWSEGPKNHRNLKILVSKFVPRGFEARRTWGFEARRHGVSRGGAGVSRRGAMGFRGAAPMIKHFSDLSFSAVPRGPV